MVMPSTIPKMFIEVCNRYTGNTDKIAYAIKIKGEWKTITHDQLRYDVECFAMGLLHEGIVPGERIGIVSENRPEWAIADFAISAIGAVDVPIFSTLPPKQEAWIFRDCQITAAIVSTELQLKKLLEAWDEIPTLKMIIVMNDVLMDAAEKHHSQHKRIVSFEHIIEAGEKVVSAEERRQKLIEMAGHVKPDDLLTLIYTSGTTGNPKGVMLSHKNLTSNIAAALSAFSITDSDIFLSYLPMCHSYERMSGYYLAFWCGTTTYVSESIETVAENMREVKPTIMTSVPRLFERIQMRVKNAAEKESALKQRIFNWAFEVGVEYFDTTVQQRKPASAMLKLKNALADKLVFTKIRQRTGNNLRFFISGGAALNYDVGKFFGAVGLVVLEGYGLTESSPVIAVCTEDNRELGTVGKPLNNVEVKIAEDGEILARGPSIMQGYWNLPEETAESIDKYGWLHTGDIGEFNERGNLRITDRKKNILVSSGGKNIAPQPIEALILQSMLIDQVLVIGDQREYCTALIVPEKEGVQDWANKNNVSYGSWQELVKSEALHKAVQTDLNRLQNELAKYQRVRKFVLISEPFTVENGMMTPTLKVKRKQVTAYYAEMIEAMYEES